MATTIQLVEGMAEILRYPKQEVLKHDRYLLENRLRSTGGRGRGAAHMTSTDAASLLGSIMATPVNNDPLRKSPESWLRYRDLPCASRLPAPKADERATRWQSGIDQLDALPEGHSALAAIAAAIECSTEPRHWIRGSSTQGWRAVHAANIMVEFHAPQPIVDIHVWDAVAGRDEVHRYFNEADFDGAERLPGIRQVRSVDFDVLLQLGQLLKRA